MNLVFSVEEKWYAEAGSVASYIFGNGKHVIVLDPDYLSNAPFSDIINAVIHESIHAAIAEETCYIDGGRAHLSGSYSLYDNIQDFVEFWRSNDKTWDPEEKEVKSRGKYREDEK